MFKQENKRWGAEYLGVATKVFPETMLLIERHGLKTINPSSSNENVLNLDWNGKFDIQEHPRNVMIRLGGCCDAYRDKLVSSTGKVRDYESLSDTIVKKIHHSGRGSLKDDFEITIENSGKNGSALISVNSVIQSTTSKFNIRKLAYDPGVLDISCWRTNCWLNDTQAASIVEVALIAFDQGLSLNDLIKAAQDQLMLVTIPLCDMEAAVTRNWFELADAAGTFDNESSLKVCSSITRSIYQFGNTVELEKEWADITINAWDRKINLACYINDSYRNYMMEREMERQSIVRSV